MSEKSGALKRPAKGEAIEGGTAEERSFVLLTKIRITKDLFSLKKKGNMDFKDYTYKEPKIKANIIEALQTNRHEQLIFGHDQKTGMRAVLAIHDTTLGPSTGGIRMANVSEEKAIEEALRLSYAMTFKNAIIDEPFGGSKAVVIGDPNRDKSKEYLHAIGNFIQSMHGAFLTGVDMGLNLDDAKVIRERTDYIFNSRGCSGVTTAHGVYKGIKQCVKEAYGSENLDGKIIAIQGLGYVGGTLVELLSKYKVDLIVADIDPKTVEDIQSKYNVEVVDTQEIYNVNCDIFVPCAVGEILNDNTIPKLKCKIVAGGANNQLKDEVKHSRMLMEREILHAPDFIINAGGVCHGMAEVKGHDLSVAIKKTDLIPGLLHKAFEISKKTKLPPMMVAYNMAAEKIIAKKKENEKNFRAGSKN